MATREVFPAGGPDSPTDRLLGAARTRGPFSPRFHAASELVGRRWTGAILFALHHGLDRFTDIKQAVPGLSARLLTERLRQLEEARVVDRVVAADGGGTRYRLTPKGDDLRPVLIALNRWADRWEHD